MRATLPLGRWAGVPVGAHVGVLAILLLVGLGLGLWQFPVLYPDRPAWMYVLAGVAAAVLLVGSVLVHELSHAVVARANGVPVERIVLWLLGGVAQLRGEPRTARADLAVAAVGPATSLALGAFFGVATVGWLALLGTGLVSATLGYLAVINVLLAGFNLVPAAPLDGGRVLRALVWWRTGDQPKAALVAARAGRAFGLTLIVVGVLQALILAWLGGLWLALVGWFLFNAAMAEEQSVRMGQKLRGVRVRDVMSAEPVTVSPAASVAGFIDDVVLRQRFSTYPLVDAGGRLSGLVTLNRIRRVAESKRESTSLADIACPPDQVPTTRPDEMLVDLLPRMAGCTDGRAVVVDDFGRVAAVVSPRDISRVAARAEFSRG